jgi:AcrR family transcriptional regulator
MPSRAGRPAESPAKATENPAASRIVAEARRHFFAHGFRGVTMDDLAAELGMSKKTLYASFPGKIDLLRAVLTDKMRSVEADLDQAMAQSSGDVLSRLHDLLASVQRHTEEIQPPFIRDLRRESPELFDIVQNRRRAIIERTFGRLFDEGRRAGLFRGDVPSRMMIEILLGATETIMNPPKLAELGLAPKESYLMIITVVLEGLLTEKARQADGGTRRRGKR